MAITWSGDQLLIEICDNGKGLKNNLLARVGEVFFTTKSSQQGHGLGLFLAKATIERFGGTLALLNRKQGGLAVHIALPLLSA